MQFETFKYNNNNKYTLYKIKDFFGKLIIYVNWVMIR